MCDIVWISPQSHSSLSVKPPFLVERITVALACPKTIQQWPLTSVKIKTGKSDCGVYHWSGIDHRSQLPVFPPPTCDINWLQMFFFNSTFSTNRLYRATGVWNVHVGPGTRQTHHKQWNNASNQENHKHSLAWVCGDDPLAMIRLPRRSVSCQSFVGMCSAFWLFWLSCQYLPSHWQVLTT